MKKKTSVIDLDRIKDELYTFAENQAEKDMLMTISTFDTKHSEMIFRNLYENKKLSFVAKKQNKIDAMKIEKWDKEFYEPEQGESHLAWTKIVNIFSFKKTRLGLTWEDAIDAKGSGLMYRIHQNTLPFISKALLYYKEHITNVNSLTYLDKFPTIKVEKKEEKKEEKNSK